MKAKNESIALLEYRNTPISNCDYSPAQLLFNRRLRDKIPFLLQPEIPFDPRKLLCVRQEKQKKVTMTEMQKIPPYEKGPTLENETMGTSSYY